MSPLTKGLFHRVIAESGSAYAPWAVSLPGLAKLKAEILLVVIGCPKTAEEALFCMQGLDVKKIAYLFYNTTEFPVANAPAGLVALEPPGDEAFLTGPISSWQPHPVPLLLSTTSAEGLLATSPILKDGTLEEVSETFDRRAPSLLLYRDTAPEPDEITKQVKNFYLRQGDITMNDWVNFTTIFNDDFFTVPILDAANQHPSDVYLYYFDYVSKGQASNPLMFGAFHCAEVEYIWRRNNMLDEEELSLSKNLVKALANFAKTGVPSGLPEEWKKWTKTEQHCMEVNRSAEFHPKKGLVQDRYNFWKSLDYRKKFDQ